jgi:Zn-dependent protease
MEYVLIGISILIALVFHELAHGYISHKLGDPTPSRDGRLTLNPMAHLDLFGTICMIVFHFGWAKPVQINSQYYKNRKLGTVLVSLAGPCMNFILALIGTILITLLPETVFSLFLYYFISINTSLGVFNLIPIPPLDGSKVLGAVLPEKIYFGYMRYEQYGMFLLMILLMTGVLTPILTVLVNFMFKLYDILLFFI